MAHANCQPAKLVPQLIARQTPLQSTIVLQAIDTYKVLLALDSRYYIIAHHHTCFITSAVFSFTHTAIFFPTSTACLSP